MYVADAGLQHPNSGLISFGFHRPQLITVIGSDPNENKGAYQGRGRAAMRAPSGWIIPNHELISIGFYRCPFISGRTPSELFTDKLGRSTSL